MDEDTKPRMRWGLRHTGAAALVMTVGQVYAITELLYTRKEATQEIKRFDLHVADDRETKRDIYVELRELSQNVATIKALLEAREERAARMRERKEVSMLKTNGHGG